jgi:hypothetical protein
MQTYVLNLSDSSFVVLDLKNISRVSYYETEREGYRLNIDFHSNRPGSSFSFSSKDFSFSSKEEVQKEFLSLKKALLTISVLKEDSFKESLEKLQVDIDNLLEKV